MKRVEISSESDDNFVNFMSLDINRNYPLKENKYNQVGLLI